MSYLLNLKNGSNKVLGGLIFLCSVTIIIFQSSFIKDFSLRNFEDILTIFSLSSILTLVLRYIGMREFLVWLFSFFADLIRKMPKEINFRTIQRSIHLQETNNSLIGTLLTFFAFFLLLIINLNTSSGVYRILFEGIQNTEKQIEPLLGNFPHLALIGILLFFLGFLMLRIYFDFQNARKKYVIVWIYFILEMNPPAGEYHTQIRKNLDNATWELANQNINEFLQKTYEDSCFCISKLKTIENSLEILEGGKLRSLKEFRYVEGTNLFDFFLRELENSMGYASEKIANIQRIGLPYLIAKQYNGFDLNLVFDNLRELSLNLTNLKKSLETTKNDFYKYKILEYWYENWRSIQEQYLMPPERKYSTIESRRSFTELFHAFIGKFQLILFQEILFHGYIFIERKEFYVKIINLFNEIDNENSDIINSITENFKKNVSGGFRSEELFEQFVTKIREINASEDKNFDLGKFTHLFLSNSDLHDKNGMLARIDFNLFLDLQSKLNRYNALFERMNSLEPFYLIIHRFESLFKKDVLINRQLHHFLKNNKDDLKSLLVKENGLKEIRSELFTRFEKISISDNMIKKYLQ
jgi:hypothetical protein